MGLKITTIAELPEKTGRAVFIYFLDYGWSDELTSAMYANFDSFAEIAAGNNGLLIAGLNRAEFANEILNWHHINNDSADTLLPAIMITDIEPGMLAGRSGFQLHEQAETSNSQQAHAERFIMLPLRELCQTTSDVSRLLQMISTDLRLGRKLSNFEVGRIKPKGQSAPADMIVLQPNVAGIGVDLKELFKWSKEKLHLFVSKGR